MRSGEGLALRIETKEQSSLKVASGMVVTGSKEGIVQIIDLKKET